jgi:glyoxylase-like metal-dependent hydrolase (beta-lactamase superfamily II)
METGREDKMLQVTHNISVENGFAGCNLGLISTSDGIVMVDTPIRFSDAVKWREVVNQKGKLRYVINTEEHPDHCQTSWFYGGTLITNQATRETLKKTPAGQAAGIIKHMDPEGVHLLKDFQLRLADITFQGNLDFYLGHHTFHLFGLPGHSPGGIGVYIPEEKAVFTTDIVFNHFKSWLQDADPAKWLESLQKLEALDLEVVVPGHGNPCKKEYLREQANLIQRWIEAVQSAIKQGWTMEEAQARVTCPDPYPKQLQTPMTEIELNRAIIARLYQIYKS